MHISKAPVCSVLFDERYTMQEDARKVASYYDIKGKRWKIGKLLLSADWFQFHMSRKYEDFDENHE